MKRTQDIGILPVYTITAGIVALLLMLLLVISTVSSVSRRTTVRAQWYPSTSPSQQPSQTNNKVQSTVTIREPEEIAQKVLITD